jgi:ABC-type branched-subunit amino acid transport system permease subunit
MGARTLKFALVALAAVAVLVLPLLVDDRFLLKVLTYVGLNVIVVTGLSLLFGYAGQVSLGHAAFVGIGAYACAVATKTFSPPCCRRQAASCWRCRACGSKGTTSRWRRWDSAS